MCNQSVARSAKGACPLQDHDYLGRYFREAQQISASLDLATVQDIIVHLAALREAGGRLFFLGVGGSAANASHAVNDFRKIAHIESYAPSDNVSELTARTNDEGWGSTYAAWLRTSRLRVGDAVFVLSVGGGSREHRISLNLVAAIDLARSAGAKIFGIVGRDGGYTARHADACVCIPSLAPDTITAHAESFQSTIWHAIVSHPLLRQGEMKWESLR